MADKMRHIANRENSGKYDFMAWCTMSPFVFLFPKEYFEK